MKLFYGIILVMMLFASACAQQTVQPATQPSEPDTTEDAMEDKGTDTDGTGAVVVEPKTTSSEVRAMGAGVFEPSELTISAGSSVTWINNANKGLVVIIFKDGGSYTNSQTIKPGEKFEHEFTEAGEYEYWQNIAFGGISSKITVE